MFAHSLNRTQCAVSRGAGTVQRKPASPVQPDRRSERGSCREAWRVFVQDRVTAFFFFKEGKVGEELWLIRSHAPLKDYSGKASAFNGWTDSPDPRTAQTVGDRRGLKDVSACEAPEHICGC